MSRVIGLQWPTQYLSDILELTEMPNYGEQPQESGHVECDRYNCIGGAERAADSF